MRCPGGRQLTLSFELLFTDRQAGDTSLLILLELSPKIPVIFTRNVSQQIRVVVIHTPTTT